MKSSKTVSEIVSNNGIPLYSDSQAYNVGFTTGSVNSKTCCERIFYEKSRNESSYTDA